MAWDVQEVYQNRRNSQEESFLSSAPPPFPVGKDEFFPLLPLSSCQSRRPSFCTLCFSSNFFLWKRDGLFYFELFFNMDRGSLLRGREKEIVYHCKERSDLETSDGAFREVLPHSPHYLIEPLSLSQVEPSARFVHRARRPSLYTCCGVSQDEPLLDDVKEEREKRKRYLEDSEREITGGLSRSSKERH